MNLLWWWKVPFVTRVALAFCAAAIILALVALGTRGLNPSVWLPSLACNLLTTGLTIFFVNDVFVRREKAVAIDRDRNLLWVWLVGVMHEVGQVREALDAGRDAAEELRTAKSTGGAVSRFMAQFGSAMQPETVATIEAITNMLVFLDTQDPERLSDELLGIERLTLSLWHNIRGTNRSETP